MKKIYMVREDQEIRKVLDQTYDTILAAVKLHKVLPLIVLGHLDAKRAEDEQGPCMLLEVSSHRHLS